MTQSNETGGGMVCGDCGKDLSKAVTLLGPDIIKMHRDMHMRQRLWEELWRLRAAVGELARRMGLSFRIPGWSGPGIPSDDDIARLAQNQDLGWEELPWWITGAEGAPPCGSCRNFLGECQISAGQQLHCINNRWSEYREKEGTGAGGR